MEAEHENMGCSEKGQEVTDWRKGWLFSKPLSLSYFYKRGALKLLGLPTRLHSPARVNWSSWLAE